MAEIRTLTVRSSADGRAICDPGGLDLPIVGRTTVPVGSRITVLLDGRQGVVIGPIRDESGAPIPDPGSGGGGVTDHGALTGLSDDDHGQYLLRSEIPGWPIIETGQAIISVASAANASAPITFSPGRFPTAPRVFTNLAGQPGGSGTLVSRAISITPTGATIFLNTGNGASVTATGVPVQWLAILEG